MASSPKPSERLIKTRFLPVTLSALVPGAGQCMQKRWVTAAIYGGLFLLASAWFAWVAWRVLSSYYRFAFEFETAADPMVSFLTVLRPFGVCMLIWSANVVDTLVAALRHPPPGPGFAERTGTVR